ncbi:ABC transporter [Pseudopedobacter saltans DSM 12145]|uniref:ABC transporter n=1 Tax=Pseudopedobacter saltans (strain ATCC 51119 / DSM 12145 / JCM 21818 / CCUG 39354 / LMG 10337 / NBRC 100064 / NCIMB 13643) TaxID=762903 RepID=F0SDU7_PSESL|nr:AAA family ATPase [Pseudopedobacter saltans]ADY51843.1 ABC transporter [Pseudopedobacter saltans DSM 12145]
MINKGSEWNVWDLHVHTPASGFANDADYPTLIENLKKSEADVIGINDYCSIQGYKKIIDLGGVDNKILFPVVELRMNNKINHKNSTATDGGVSINFHIIFDNSIDVNSIEVEINSLECKFDGGNESKLGHVTNPEELKKISFDYFETIKKLNSSILKNKFLIWVPYDEYGGIDAIDPVNDGFFKLGIINIAHLLGSGNQKQIDYFLSDRCVNDVGKNIACLKGSDAHQLDYPFGKLRDRDSKPTARYCWIKGEKSFKALQHLIVEPIDRVLIKDKNPIEERINTNRTKYIDSIKLNSVAGYDPKTQGEWFNNIEIPLNPELVAIIGNKGNGKSALADIIGLCGDYSGSHDDFSFLNKKRFGENNGRKSSNFEATLTWKSGNSVTKNLNDKVAESVPEKVKYLPQGYFERLTNNHDSVEDFNREIENVVFTHLEEADKLGKNTFQQLIDFKTSVTEEEILGLKNKLLAINKSLFEKEKKLNPEYKKGIENQIQLKDNELKALIEPNAVPNPNDDPEHAKNNLVINQKLFELNQKIEDETELLISTTNKKSNILIEINNLKAIKQKIENKLKEFEFFKIEIKDELLKYGLDINTILTITSNLESIDRVLTVKDDEYTKIKVLLGEENSDDPNFKTIPQKINELKLQQARIQNELGEADKIYQNYLINKKHWEENRNKIIGNVATSGSLEFFKNEIKYINEILDSEIQTERELRIEVTKEIFELKESVLGIYKNVKQKIDKIIEENAYLLAAYPIQVEASFVLKSNFQKKFLEYISLNKIGTFYGKENAELQLKKILEQSSLDTFDNISDLLKSITNALFVDLRDANNQSTNIENQVSDVVELYDYLFSLDFVDYNYELRQGNKSLNQLSPGEKGALLLIFYLLLDNNDIPLIIDQPEDNLDNHSVANILVPFIKKAKAKRQIILVTHNPNLAVVADAEQVIFTELDKENNYKFSFKAGAIENPVINDCIVKVLEGAMPAFNKRKLKYYE